MKSQKMRINSLKTKEKSIPIQYKALALRWQNEKPTLLKHHDIMLNY